MQTNKKITRSDFFHTREWKRITKMENTIPNFISGQEFAAKKGFFAASTKNSKNQKLLEKKIWIRA